MTAPGPGRGGGSVRYCAVGWPVDPTAASTLQSYLDAVAEVLDRTVGDPQHLGAETAGAPPTLVAFPEHTGLTAMFVGSRGEEARGQLAAGAGTMEVFTALAIGYGEVLGHVASRFPGVTSAGRLLHLACTDVVVRTLVEGFAELAARRGVWLTVGAALPGWRSVPVETLDADVAALLLGPDHADAATVHVPTGAEVRNRNLVISPDEGLVAVHDKVALVPLEADADEGLGLSAAGLSEVEVVDLPVGRIGTVISKDAWMPDVNERLDQLGAEVLVQPEAYDRWARPDREPGTGRQDLWPPDKLQRGGWWMLRRHRSLAVNVTPVLRGGFADGPFDGQPLVATADPGPGPRPGLLGQPDDVGWAAVGGWPGPDLSDAPDVPGPVPARPTDPAAARRTAARRDVARPCDDLVVATVRLPDRPARAPLPAPVAVSRPVAAGTTGLQLVPDLVVDADAAWLAWVSVGGRCSGVQAQRWDAAVDAPPLAVATTDGPGSDPTSRRWRPRLAPGPTGPVCLHLGFGLGSWDLLAAFVSGGHPPVRVDDAELDPGVLRERGHDAPRLVRHGEDLVAVWSDLRWPLVLPQVRLARSGDGGRTWSATRRVDGGPDRGQQDPLAGRSPAETRGQTAPAAVVVPDGLLVVWQELGPEGTPAIHGVRLRADVPLGPVLRLDGGQGPAYRPAVAAVGDTVWLVFEDAGAHGGLQLRVSHDGGATFSPVRPLDPSHPPGGQQRAAVVVPPLVAGMGRTGSRLAATVVFEDHRGGAPAVLAIDVDDGGALGPVRRIDDAPPGAMARAPAAARQDGLLLVAWQDTRDGPDRLRCTAVPAP